MNRNTYATLEHEARVSIEGRWLVIDAAGSVLRLNKLDVYGLLLKDMSDTPVVMKGSQ